MIFILFILFYSFNALCNPSDSDEYIHFIHGSAGSYLFPMLSKTNGILFPYGVLNDFYHIAPLGGDTSYLQYYLGYNKDYLSTLGTSRNDFRLAAMYAELKSKSFKDVKEMEDFYSDKFLNALNDLANYNPETAKHSILYEASKLKFHTLQFRTFCNNCYLKVKNQHHVNSMIENVKAFNVESKESEFLKARQSMGWHGVVFHKLISAVSSFSMNPVNLYLQLHHKRDSKYKDLMPISTSKLSNSQILNFISEYDQMRKLFQTPQLEQAEYQDTLRYTDSDFKPFISLTDDDRKFMTEPLPVILEGRMLKSHFASSSSNAEMALKTLVHLDHDIYHIHVRNERDRRRVQGWLNQRGLHLSVSTHKWPRISRFLHSMTSSRSSLILQRNQPMLPTLKWKF